MSFDNQRVICWFSCGATSAVAAKMAIQKYKHDHEIIVAYCDTGSEHPDNMRFLSDCKKWFNHEIIILKSPDYNNIWEVFERKKFLTGINGAPCTNLLKKEIRKNFQRSDDIQIFGYTYDENNRIERFRQQNPSIDLELPLLEGMLTSENCKAILQDAGIELPFMYRQQKSGTPYGHNNCIGCVKGGMGYWNKIRIDFPEQFDRMAKLERLIGRALNKKEEEGRKAIPVYLDELDPNAGFFEKEKPIDCDLLCGLAYRQYGK